MSHRLLPLVLFALVVGCAPPEGETHPALVDERGEVVVELELGEGQRAALFAEGADEIKVSGAGWQAVLDGDRVTVRAAYAAAPKADLVVTWPAHEVTLPLTLRPLTWRALPSWAAGEGPAGREYFTFWVDPDDADTAWLYGGFHYRPEQFTPGNDLWRLDLVEETWTAVDAGDDAPARGGASVAVGPRAVVLSGGLARDDEGFLLPFTLHQWVAGDAPSWQPRAPLGAPVSGRYQPALFWVERLDAFVTVAGSQLPGPTNTAEMFDPVNDTWTTLALGGAEAPAPRDGFAWAYQASAQRLVVFAGELGNARANDTWALRLGDDPPRWEPITPAGEVPIARRNAAYVYDPDAERLFVFGGTPDGMTSAPGLWALDLTPGEERWDLVRDTTEDGPEPRSSGGAIYDAARGRVLFGFGNNDRVYEDLWALEL